MLANNAKLPARHVPQPAIAAVGRLPSWWCKTAHFAVTASGVRVAAGISALRSARVQVQCIRSGPVLPHFDGTSHHRDALWRRACLRNLSANVGRFLQVQDAPPLLPSASKKSRDSQEDGTGPRRASSASHECPWGSMATSRGFEVASGTDLEGRKGPKLQSCTLHVRP